MQIRRDHTPFVVSFLIDLPTQLPKGCLGRHIGPSGIDEHLASLEDLTAQEGWSHESQKSPCSSPLVKGCKHGCKSTPCDEGQGKVADCSQPQAPHDFAEGVATLQGY